MKLIFDIDMPDEHAAGIRGFTDTITVNVESGNPGGDPGEFEGFMLQALEDWYDGGHVKQRDPHREVK